MIILQVPHCVLHATRVVCMVRLHTLLPAVPSKILFISHVAGGCIIIPVLSACCTSIAIHHTYTGISPANDFMFISILLKVSFASAPRFPSCMIMFSSSPAPHTRVCVQQRSCLSLLSKNVLRRCSLYFVHVASPLISPLYILSQ